MQTTYEYADAHDPFTVSQLTVSKPVLTGSGWALQEVSRRYQTAGTDWGYTTDVQSTQPQPPSGILDSGNMVGITYRYDTSDPVSASRVMSVSYPDKTATLYTYEATTTNFTTISSHGEPDYWNFVGEILNGEQTTTVVDNVGRVRSVTMRNIKDGTVGIILSQQTYYYPTNDLSGRDHYVVDLAGRTNAYEYACCGLATTTDADGVVTSFTYDIMRRPQISTVVRGAESISTYNVFDGLGRALTTYRSAGGIVITNVSRSYDVLGRVVAETNALGGFTSTTYGLVNNQRCVTNTYPDGGTRIQIFQRDGRLQTVLGTAAFPVAYQYGLEEVDSIWREYVLEINLTATGGTNEWVKTILDSTGRTLKVVYPSAAGEVAASSHYAEGADGGQLLKQIDPDGVAKLFSYNSQGELTVRAVDVNQDANIDYSGSDRISMTTNEVVNAHGMNVVRDSTYAWLTDISVTATLVSSVDRSPDGLHLWSIFWNNGVAVTSESHTFYDSANGYRIVTNAAPNGSYTVTTNRYGRIISQTQRGADGTIITHTTYGYDTHGRQFTVTDARTGTTTNWFNNANQLSSTKTPVPGSGQNALVTTNYFDNMGRIWKITLADNSNVTNKYDVTGLITNTFGSRTYPMGYVYDSQGRMVTMKTWKDFANNSGTATTIWNYDIYRGWLTNKTYDGGLAGPVYSYTPAGRLKSRIWARGVGTTNIYNNAGDLMRVDYSDSTPDVGYGYSRNGRQTTVTNNNTLVCSMAFDNAGSLLSETYSSGVLSGLSVTNGYDQYLRRTNLTTLNGGSVLARTSYGYDASSRLKNVVDGVNTVAYGYVDNSPLVGSVWFTNNGTLRMTTTKSYDYLNRLTAITNAAGGSNVTVFNYANNTANQRTSITNVDNSRWVYQYDALGQVVSGKKYWSDGTPVAGQQFEYGFDDIGNRKSTAAGGDSAGTNLRYVSYTNNTLNQITGRDVPGYVNLLGAAKTNATVTLWGDNGSYSATSRKGEYFRGELAVTNAANSVWLTITNLAVLANGASPDIVTNTTGNTYLAKTPEIFYFDLDGNLTNDGRWTYTWDAENRLVRMVTYSGPQKRIEFDYDWDGRRISKRTWNNTTGSGTPSVYFNYVYDRWNLIAEMASFGGNSLLQGFSWGLDLSGSLQRAGGVGGLLMSRDSAGRTNSFAYDGNGNVMALVNATNGAVTAQYEYGPFGEAIRSTGVSAAANPFRFSAKFQDDESDLLYYGYRYCNASTGRWLSRDPIQEDGGGNLYGFVCNDPIRKWDRFGLQCCLITYSPGSYTANDGSTTRSWFGHSVLQCDSSGSYVSLFPGEGSMHGTIPKPGVWHDPQDDAAAYPNASPSRVCFDCLDEDKVAAWLAKAKADHMEWSLGNECANVTSQAVAAGLGNQTKPDCGCSRSADQRWVVQDLLNPNVGIVMPSQMESLVKEMVKNGCNRYKCVLQNLHHGRPTK